jgi:hypothetical protein
MDYVTLFPHQEELRQPAKSKRLAINVSNIVNLILFYKRCRFHSKCIHGGHSFDTGLAAGSFVSFILWFTADAMKKSNKYNYPIGKRRMQSVVRTLFNKPCHFDLVESRLQI